MSGTYIPLIYADFATGQFFLNGVPCLATDIFIQSPSVTGAVAIDSNGLKTALTTGTPETGPCPCLSAAALSLLNTKLLPGQFACVWEAYVASVSTDGTPSGDINITIKGNGNTVITEVENVAIITGDPSAEGMRVVTWNDSALFPPSDFPTGNGVGTPNQLAFLLDSSYTISASANGSSVASIARGITLPITEFDSWTFFGSAESDGGTVSYTTFFAIYFPFDPSALPPASPPGTRPGAPGPILPGQVIRAGCSLIAVTDYNSDTGTYTGVVSGADLPTIPNDPFDTTFPIAADSYGVFIPSSTVSGLDYLEGKQVMASVDGLPQGPFTVADGEIALTSPGSIIVVGLSYTPQLQTLRLEMEGVPTLQGRRKLLQAVDVIVADTLGLKVGGEFSSLFPMPDLVIPATLPPPTLRSGVFHALTGDGWNIDGQVCFQQDWPLPATILGVVYEVEIGDDGA